MADPNTELLALLMSRIDRMEDNVTTQISHHARVTSERITRQGAQLNGRVDALATSVGELQDAQIRRKTHGWWIVGIASAASTAIGWVLSLFSGGKS